MKRRALIAAYWFAAVICGGHASNEVYRDARLSGRSLEDAMLVGAIAGVGASIGWPVYLSAKAWGGYERRA